MSRGLLQVVATPIGNLQDISPRAVAALRDCDLLVAEDTRHTGALLRHLGLNPPLQAMHEHNEETVLPRLLARLADGETLALVSDAGTPLISDPGYRLVRAAGEAGAVVLAVPGPSAVTAALSVSGLPTDRFVFEGFLPNRAGPRRRRLRDLQSEPRTVVFFEASHRIADALADLEAAWGGDRPVTLCRELTKRFETVLRGTVSEVRERVGADPDQRRGEFVLVVGGAPQASADLDAALDLARELARELPASKAARIAARVTGAPRRALFDALNDGGAAPDTEA